MRARDEGHVPSPDEQATLRAYSSWGAFPDVFDTRLPQWAPQREQLQSLLSEAEYASARATVNTSFFTPPALTQAVWGALEQAGFTEGRVLEPGCGIGGFIHAAPTGAHVVGVERDAVTALIASALYPDAQIRQQSFEAFDVADSTFHATVGNVPFIESAPYDPERNRAGLSTHNYFISKSIDLTAPGGYVAVITSQHTADSPGRTHSVQDLLTEKADLITAYRLPGGKDGAFADSGTEVGTDLLVFRVREQGQEPTAATELFRQHGQLEVNGVQRRVNQFFLDNPDHVLGQWTAVSGRFGAELTVTEGTESATEALAAGLRRDIARAVEQGRGHTPTLAGQSEALDVGGLIADAKESISTTLGSLRYERDGANIAFQQFSPTPGTTAGQWVDVKCAKKYQEQWAQLIDLRDTTEAVLTACRDANEETLPALRAKLNEQYDAYVDSFGPINRFEWKAPRAKTAAQTEKSYRALEQEWRKANAVNDRPWEGDLPDEVASQLRDEAADNGAPTKAWPHLAGAINNDPYLNTVRALESFNEDTQEANKGALFTTNPLRAVEVPETVESLSDAVTIARHTGLELTATSLAKLLGTDDVAHVERELVDKALAFRDHHNPEKWIPAPQYLSGSLRPREREAAQLAEVNPLYAANASALKQALPEKITHGITMNLGAPWIPQDIYRDYIAEVLDIPEQYRDEISFVKAADTWSLEVPQYWPQKKNADLKWGVCADNAMGEYNFRDKKLAALSHSGVAHRGHDSTVFTASQTLECALNMQPPRLNISREAKGFLGHDPESNTPIMHRAATQYAHTKVDAIQEHFAKWTVAEPERFNRLVDIYNDRFNSVVAPAYDGTSRLMPGLSNRFTPYDYQLNAVERMVSEPGVLLNHVVGAGKTGSMIMGAMELKRLGIAQQPWIVVPNHLVDQIGREAKQWYPGANVLVGATSDSPSKQRQDRDMLLAQAGQGDWDMVIVSDNAFRAASLSSDAMEDYYNEKISGHRQDLEALRDAPGDHSLSIKKIERMIENYEKKLDIQIAQAENSDSIKWDHTGADYLIVDEAHNYKNLFRVSPLSDLACPGSDKATDMDMKLHYLRQRKNDPTAPTVTFATGTPIANNIAELWVMQHYLRPDLLQEAGIDGINAWGSTFTSKVTDVDFSAGGQLKEKTRISSYQNVAELAQISSPVIDSVDRDQIPAKLPTLRGGKNITVEFEIAQEDKDFITDLQWREEHLPEDPRVDNPLKLVNDGKAVSLDPRMVNLPNTPGIGRVHAVVSNILNEWESNRDNQYLDQHGNVSSNTGALQIVFCDKGVPNTAGRFSMYDAIRDDLVAQGMDKDRIRFIHEWDDRRLQLFADCNNGKVDVLIANTPKLATGANIQSRAIALHHVDVPWRPADLSQQEGRIIRQGNQNPEVGIYNYIAQGTYDAYSWGVVNRKAQFISQFFKADRSMRSMPPLEDDGLDALAHNKANATGNPIFIEQAELGRTVRKLEAEETEHKAVAQSNEYTIRVGRQQLSVDTANVERLRPLVPTATAWAETPLEQRSWNLGGATQHERGDALQALFDRLTDIYQSRSREPQAVGTIGGISFSARYSAVASSVEITSSLGRMTNEIPPYLFSSTLAEGVISEKDLQRERWGLLSTLENTTRKIGTHVDALDSRIAKNRAVIDRLEPLPDAGQFPKQAELDQARARQAEIQKELAAFNSSAAERARVAAYQARLADKGRSSGFSLALNPTGFMKDEGIEQHPNAPKPRKTEEWSLMADLPLSSKGLGEGIRTHQAGSPNPQQAQPNNEQQRENGHEL